MSLRLRMVLLTVALVAVVAFAFSWVYLDNLLRSLSTDAIDRSNFAGQQIKTYLIDHITQHSRQYDATTSVEATKANWTLIASTDEDIEMVLSKTAAASKFILETNVANEDGEILVSSNPLRTRQSLLHLAPVSELNRGSLYRRFTSLFYGADYEEKIPIGITGDDPRPVFAIQIVTSNALLRQNLLPPVRDLGLLAALALLGTIILTVLVSTSALRPIHRIQRTIDRIATGSFRTEEMAQPSPVAKEFRVMESKLNLLGQQMRGAREDASQLRHNVDQLLERFEAEYDVATRLAAISKLTGGVAHEIKNPLNAIVLRLDLLREKLGEPDEELREELDILSREALRLDRVVKTFLDFSRPVEVHWQEVDLASVAKEVTDLMKPQARLGHIEVHFECTGENPVVRGDPDILKQATLNLVTNGMEAMKEGGRLDVSVAATNGHVHLKVADTGAGIAPELRNRVFQLYFTTKSKGSGFGLAMTYRAAQLHNGTIDFTSEPGRGTTFHMEFPALVRHA